MVGLELFRIFARKDYGTCPWEYMFENAKNCIYGLLVHIREAPLKKTQGLFRHYPNGRVILIQVF